MKPYSRARRIALVVLILTACCVLVSLITKWFVSRSYMYDFGDAVDIQDYRPLFERFLDSKELADGEQVNGENLPDDLRAIGIVNVYRNGRFVYFVLTPNCFIGDCVIGEFIWQRDDGRTAIEEILRTTKRNTYHILHFHSVRRWYYWSHD